MTKKRKKHAGGRKRVSDPKQRVVLFIATSCIEAWDGMEGIKKHLYEAASETPKSKHNE